MSACFRLSYSLDLECIRPSPPHSHPPFLEPLQPYGQGETRSPVNRRERMQLSGATGIQVCPSPTPLLGGGEGAGW